MNSKSKWFQILCNGLKFAWFVVLCGLAGPLMFVLLFFDDDPSISSTGYILMAFVVLPSVICFVYWLPIWLYRFIVYKKKIAQKKHS